MKLDYNVTMGKKDTRSKYRDILTQFIANGAPVAEVKLSCTQRPNATATYFRAIIKNMGANVKATVRGGHLYLVKGDS